ncbi:hypothetical protein KPG71_04655 [Roseovarius sp. PS-C2]|uniref:hypothetical protein n=1 Tax=Roseovarius sp. PS-C2 TaxID=2820814 RepID=UPI001C0D9951|nr:hypothetical protein [Roseovarius sp. PS-C2]MBU3259300.1 hypothetical protein [Roseovarius sp. PS-C2]
MTPRKAARIIISEGQPLNPDDEVGSVTNIFELAEQHSPGSLGELCFVVATMYLVVMRKIGYYKGGWYVTKK